MTKFERTERQGIDQNQNLELIKHVSNLIPIAMYACDPTGLLAFFNNVSVRVWGRTPPIGDLHEKFCGSYKLYLPNGSLLPHDKSPMATTLRTKKIVADIEVVIERPDATRVTVIANTAPLIDGRGKLIGAINCMVDITERKLMAQRLKESEERFRHLSEAATQGILVHKNRRLLDCNTALEQMFGYSRKELIGRDGMFLVPVEWKKDATRKSRGSGRGTLRICWSKKKRRKISWKGNWKKLCFSGNKGANCCHHRFNRAQANGTNFAKPARTSYIG
jgi:PAS domain S-box-containing protein